MKLYRRLSSRHGDSHPGPQRADLEVGGTPGSWAELLRALGTGQWVGADSWQGRPAGTSERAAVHTWGCIRR